MKIVCENCGAKYSIADEKVKGKVFKIRCKKCSESILVRGDTPKAESQPEPRQTRSSPPEEEGEAETRVFDYGAGKGQLASVGAEPIWHIVVDDQQQGPYTEAQIKEYISAGSITSDTLIWREGFDDWMSVRDVPEFGAMAQPAMTGSNEALFDEQPTAYRGGGALFDEQPGGGGLFSGGSSASPFDSGGGLFGDSAPSGDVFSSTAPEAAVSDGGLFGDSGGGRIGGDIFAAKEPMPATSGEGIFSTRHEEPIAHQQQPGPRVKAEQAMLTGQRNENSVLFSLSNLQALAAAPSNVPSGGAGDPGDPGFSGLGAASTGEEASGLIDIRSLAGSISTAEQNDSVDDLISMSAGGFSPALGAPVLAAQNEGMSNTMKIGIIAGGIAALVLIVVVLVIVLSGDDEARTQSEAQILALQRQIEELTKKGGNTEAIAALEAQIKAKEKQAGDQETAKTEEEGDDGKNDDKAASSGGGSKARKSTGGSKSSSSRTSRTSGSSSSSSSSGGDSKSSGSSHSSGSSSSASSSTPSPKSKSSGSSELDDLLGGASPSRSKPKPASSSQPKSSGGESNAKASLSRADVQNGMANVAPAVKRCGQGKGGTITMNVMIGKTGRVSSASAVGAFAGTPIGSCAARAVRRAKFPASQQTLNVKYPFKL